MPPKTSESSGVDWKDLESEHVCKKRGTLGHTHDRVDPPRRNDHGVSRKEYDLPNSINMVPEPSCHLSGAVGPSCIGVEVAFGRSNEVEDLAPSHDVIVDAAAGKIDVPVREAPARAHEAVQLDLRSLLLLRVRPAPVDPVEVAEGREREIEGVRRWSEASSPRKREGNQARTHLTILGGFMLFPSSVPDTS